MSDHPDIPQTFDTNLKSEYTELGISPEGQALFKEAGVQVFEILSEDDQQILKKIEAQARANADKKNKNDIDHIINFLKEKALADNFQSHDKRREWRLKLEAKARTDYDKYNEINCLRLSKVTVVLSAYDFLHNDNLVNSDIVNAVQTWEVYTPQSIWEEIPIYDSIDPNTGETRYGKVTILRGLAKAFMGIVEEFANK